MSLLDILDPRPETSAAISLPVLNNPAPSASPSARDRAAELAPADAPDYRRTRLPGWLKKRVPMGEGLAFTDRLLTDLKLTTVCEEAKCPNRMECWDRKTATFMVMGDTCTRPCGFCAVKRGRPEALEADEPARVAEAVVRLGLSYVVITSVTRDDLPDGGADHFRQCVLAVRERAEAKVEILTPDFDARPEALDIILDARPDVFNHNIETVSRLQRYVRRKANYRTSLDALKYVKDRDPAKVTKSGIMLGLGESRDEIMETFAELRSAGVDVLTVGQYLQPSHKHLPVERFLTPEEFAELGRLAEMMGFAHVASAPFVRSSYHADEAWLLATTSNASSSIATATPTDDVA